MKWLDRSLILTKPCLHGIIFLVTTSLVMFDLKTLIFALCLNPCCIFSNMQSSSCWQLQILFQRQIQRDSFIFKFSLHHWIGKLSFKFRGYISGRSYFVLFGLNKHIYRIHYSLDTCSLFFFFTSNCILQSQFLYLLIADCHMFLHLLSKMKQMAPLISEKHHLSYSDPTEALSVNMSWWENKCSILWVPQSRFLKAVQELLVLRDFHDMCVWVLSLHETEQKVYLYVSVVFVLYRAASSPRRRQ